MLLGWFDARRATEVAIVLADEFASATASGPLNRGGKTPAPRKQGDALRDFLRRAEREVGALQLNFYKKAKLANSFKWRLLEKGIESSQAADITQTLVMHLSMNRLTSVTGRESSSTSTDRPGPRKVQDYLAQATQYVAQGAYAEAVTAYQAFIKLNPRHAVALNNLGAALCKLGRSTQAEAHFRQAIRIKPRYPDAHSNLGAVLRGRGHLTASENSLRRALQLNPSHVDAQVGLGLTLVALGRPDEARPHLEKVLKVTPADAAALLGMGQILSAEGHFDEAKAMFDRVLEADPNEPNAWAGLAGLRKMTSSDLPWLKRAEEIVSSGGIAPAEEANLRFAIGKYCDDVGDFARAFQSYKRGNDIRKGSAEPYDRDERKRYVDDLTRVYTRDTTAPGDGASDSPKPVFVVGMPRSGTSLVEQIIASHPAAVGAGELIFWTDAVRRHEATVRREPLGAPLKKKLGEAYLRTLASHSVDASRIVDKAPINADHLGVIHSVFPHARIIYMRRDPIDTCLSCYFQQFSSALNFTMDLSDLAHYYQEHRRLMTHWRTVLPPGTVLDVPYAQLVSDQEEWTRRILDFVGLEWDERCLNFHSTQRTVATASAWQVRQKIYKSAVGRWHNYEKFIGPLRTLQEPDE